jgi:hypothetical protein
MITFYTIFGIACFYITIALILYAIASVWLDRGLKKRAEEKKRASKPITRIRR